MIFSVQRFVEEYVERRGLTDVDQYAVKAANAFDRAGDRPSEDVVARELAKIRTVFFRRNEVLRRKEFETALAARLQRQFSKKKSDAALESFRAVVSSRRRRKHRLNSISSLLSDFRAAVESRAVDSFWRSRRKRQLRPKPESLAQGLLAVFAKAVVGERGLVLREFESGIGFVDVGISFGGPLHLVELKILKSKLLGPNQLENYMRLERRTAGWLVLIDVRAQKRRVAIPSSLQTKAGTIRTIVIDVNPIPPHRT